MMAFESEPLKIKVKAVCSLNLSLYRMTYFLVDVLREGELLGPLIRWLCDGDDIFALLSRYMLVACQSSNT